MSPVPVAVGFGVASAAQASELAPHADGVIVGSALVKLLNATPMDFRPALGLVRELARALRRGAGVTKQGLPPIDMMT